MNADAPKHRIIPRRTVVRWIIFSIPVLMVVVGILMNMLVGNFFGLQQLAQSSPTLAAARMLTIAQVIFGIMAVTTVGVGAYVIRYAIRSLRCGVFPPLGAWLIEGGATHTGNKARALAWFQMGLGIVLIVTGCVTIYYSWGVLPEFLSGG